MRILYLLLLASLITGCAGRRYTSYRDSYESARIDQLSGNNVSGRVLQRTILCLNARRESRELHGITNVNVELVTNMTVVILTNQTIVVTTNQSRTLATNVVALPSPASLTQTNEAAPPETNQIVVTAIPSTTNVTVTTANNVTLSQAGNQLSSIASFQTQLSRQVTVSTNNISLTTADNLILSAETNHVLITQTNITVSPVTNEFVLVTNVPVRDYYLFTEMTPPPDFTLQPGESLILLVDGVRYALAPNSTAAYYPSRKGFATTFYKVPPELLVDVGNAREVRVRIRGVSSVIDRKMNNASRNAFKKYLLRYFLPPPPATSPKSRAEADLAASAN